MIEVYEELKNSKFFLIAGPCVIETLDELKRIAEFLSRECLNRKIPLIFKSSWKKANRSSLHSYTGVGLEKGMRFLETIKYEFDVPVITDIHETSEAAPVTEVADIIQIPAFLSRQTDLICAAARTGKTVNIKKGQFMASEDIRQAAEKVESCDNKQIILTERGSCFGYHDLIVDFRSFAVMKEFGYPLVYDVTHSLQKPGIGKVSGGSPQYVPMMARAALATSKVDGLFIETHPQPSKALSDAASMLPLDEMPQLLDDCLEIIYRRS